MIIVNINDVSLIIMYINEYNLVFPDAIFQYIMKLKNIRYSHDLKNIIITSL